MTTRRRTGYAEDAIDDLTPRQREVLALLAKRRTNGEIASELGISLDGAKWHVSEVIGRLGVDTREEAADCWRRYNGLPARLRRGIAGLAGVGALRWTAAGAAVVVVGLAAALVLALQDEDAPAATSTPNDPTATPGVTATPPGPASFSLQPAPGVLEQRTYAAGQQIAESYGIFFMDPATGEIEGWVTDQGLISWYVSADGRYSSFAWSPYLLDRERAQAVTWPADRFSFIGGEGDYLLFEEVVAISEPGDVPRTTGSGVVLATSPEGVVRATAHLPSERHYRAFFRPGTAEAALVSNDAVYGVDLATGDVRQLLTIPPLSGGLVPSYVRVEGLRSDDMVLSVLYRSTQFESPPPTRPLFEAVWRLGWDGTVYNLIEVDSPWAGNVHFSPDGRYVVWEEYLGTPDTIAYGTMDRWATLVLADARTMQPIFRIRSAGVMYGDLLEGNRWLADSSGFIAMIRGDPLGGRFDQVSYVVVETDGSMQPLPVPPAAGIDWFSRADNFGPVPSPGDPNLIAFGRLALFNRATGQWFRAIADPQGPVHLPSWAGGQLVFGTPHGGHGGLSPPVMLDAKVERPPFASVMGFVVARSETCVYVRATPGMDGERLTCLPDGSRLVLEEQNDPSVEASGTAAVRDEMWWVHVRTPAGEVGWVASPYLDWE